MRYAEARMDEAERNEIFKIYISEHMRALVGSDARYYDIAHGIKQADFDADEVVDNVIARMGLEEE